MNDNAAQARALALLREEQGAWACIRVGAAAAAILLLVLARVWAQSHLRQVIVPISGGTIGALSVLMAHRRLGQRRVDAAWGFLSGGAIVTYASLELAFSGIGIAVAVGGLFALLRVLGVEGRAAAGRGAFAAIAFAFFILVINALPSLPRVDAASVPPLAPAVQGLTAALGLGVLWHYFQSFRKAHTLRVRMLVAFLVMVALTAGPIVATSVALTYLTNRDRAMAQLESVMALKEAEISAWVEDRGADVRLLVAGEADALRAVLADPRAEGARTRLYTAFRLRVVDKSHFDELFLMDARGRIVFASNPRSEGEFRGLQEYFREGRQRPGMFVQTLSFSSTSESVNTVITVEPVRDATGTLVGVMAARASLAKLNEIMLERAGLGETGQTYMVGSNQVLLTGSRFPGYSVGETYLSSEGVLAALVDHQSGHGLYNDYRREPVLGVYRFLPSLRVALIGEIGQAEAFRPARLMTTISIQVAAAAMLSAAFASLLFTRSIAAPVTSLAETAARIAAGERHLVASVARQDEIGALAEAFNHMTSDLRGTIDALQARERALRVSQQQLQAMMDNSTAVISARSAEGHLLLINRRFEEVFKVRRSEIMNDPRAVSVIRAASPRANAVDRAVLETGEPQQCEEALELEDGEHTFLTVKYPLHDADGAIYAVCGISTDITERKRAEDALRRERDLLARVMATSPAGITVVDRSGQITFANARAESVLGLPRSKLLDRTYDDPAFRITDYDGQPLPPEDLPFARVREARQTVVGIPHAIAWPDGRRILLSITAAPLFDAKGEFDGMIAAVEDVTDRVRAEIELQKAHDELEVRVRERTRELEIAQRELVDAARRAGRAEIATNVLHNVGNVLNSVNTSASLLAERIRESRGQLLVQVSRMFEDHRDDLAAFLTEDAKGRQVPRLLEHLARNLVEERARHLEDVASLIKNIAHIKTIVQLQQSHAGAAGVHEPTSLSELLEDAVRIVTASPAAAPIRLVREIEAVPSMSLEKHKLLQILINLVSNAKHAVLAAPTEDKQITLRLRKTPAGTIVVEVQDNGVGIAPENMTRIFQHGFTTRREGHGFGLHSGALAARELRGSLTVRSDGPGKGACFTLELPVPGAAGAGAGAEKA